ncbi:hypothetical protein EC912_102740 [Luteibacter rhizovicinus]|uniref:CENP-V/GFA domain-containing protein n=1 Tax=Luteibacter rhizovicinus TaxID=242606 RepID=A0A4V2W4M0_9GAMM|nr:GFA family protein [Luteibacter rhizovicinus]TCV96389.1 hypothetical protein EC912_102740 [Luteibacter rhizovicinus]
MTVPQFVRCLCGTVNIELNGLPVARAYCHCESCRDFYGTSMLSATAWDAAQVIVDSRSVATYPHPAKQLSRTYCKECGETVFGTNRLAMRVLPNSIVARAAGGDLPNDIRPTMHLFYRHRIVDIVDELPKYFDGWGGPIYEAP